MLKKALLTLAVILLLLQFYRPARNISSGAQPKALKNKFSIPPNIQSAFTAACYDCHSNNTKYPWYAEVQPINLFLTRHVNEGKQELNFDEFLNYTDKRQIKKMKEIAEVIENQEMPLTSYTLIHRDAVLSENQRTEIIAWANNIRKQLESKHVEN
jgi:hypothetical protein